MKNIDFKKEKNLCIIRLSQHNLHYFCQAKKAREQAALKNAQSLFEELDAEREKKERREKAAAKKRNKRKEKKRKEQAEKMVSETKNQGNGAKSATAYSCLGLNWPVVLPPCSRVKLLSFAEAYMYMYIW